MQLADASGSVPDEECFVGDARADRRGDLAGVAIDLDEADAVRRLERRARRGRPARSS